MRTRRLFWLGAAVLLSVAALVAIAAVLTGGFGPTQGRVLATVGLLFGCGSTVLAGRACIERGVVRIAAYAAIVLASVAFVYWTVGVWTTYSSDAAGKAAGVLAAWVIALLLTTTLRLLLRSERLRPLYVATVVAALLAAALGTTMIVRDTGEGWQVLAVLVILTAAGYFLVPILQRFSAAEEAHERLLGTIGAVEVVALQGNSRSIRIGDQSVRVGEDETIVVRERP